MLQMSAKEKGAIANYWLGLADLDEMGLLLHLLDEETTFIDIGANVGVYSVLAGKVCGARVIAFEPVKATFERLQSQISLNGIGPRVTMHNMAVGASATTIQFSNDKDVTNKVVTSEMEDYENLESVQMMRLDDIPNKATRYILKIDVEGFEVNVLEGARSLFDRSLVDAAIVETNANGLKYGFSDDDIFAFFSGYGFTPVSYDPLARSMKPINQSDHTMNTIFVRHVDEAQARCRVAAGHVIHSASGVSI